jgi:hypothetical protein
MLRHASRTGGTLIVAAVLAGCGNEFSTDPTVAAQIEQAASWPAALDVGDTTMLEIKLVAPALGDIAVPRVSWQSSNETLLRIEPIPANSGDARSDSLAARRTRVRAIALGSGTVTLTVSLTANSGIAQVERSFDVLVRRWKQAVGSTNRTCGLTGRGLAYCWGALIGTTSQSPNYTPRLVSLPFAENVLRFRTLSAGQTHVCGAVFGTGAWFCWGENFYGQLTNGSTVDEVYPVAMNLNSVAITDMSVSDLSTCGIAPSHLGQNFVATEIFCWGRPEVLNSGRVPEILSPVEAWDDDYWGCELGTVCPGYYAVDVGTRHACALFQGIASSRRTDFVACWGDNAQLQLGRPDTLPWLALADTVLRAVVPAGAAHALTAVVATKTSSCVLNAGDLICWGGRYGRAPTRALPSVLLSTLTDSRDGNHVCGVGANDGRAYCLDLSTGATIPSTNIAADGRTLRFVSVMTAGYVIQPEGRALDQRHYCGITTPDGSMYCWGANTFGQLGRNTQGVTVTAPVRVQDP